MWRSLFLHEFIDSRIKNFAAMPGSLAPGSLTLVPAPDPLSGINSISITPGKEFEYKLEKPLTEAIGFSCRVRLAERVGAVPWQTVPIINLGSVAQLNWVSFFPPELEENADILTRRISIQVGGQFMNLADIEIPRAFTDLRLDWHTSGQVSLFVNNELVAYHNAVTPGAVLNIDRVMFGIGGGQSNALTPNYRIAKVFVRVLERADSMVIFGKLLPPINVGPDPHHCNARARGSIMAMANQLRKFMGAFHQANSQPWSRVGGPSEGPFNDASERAHKLASTAGLEFFKMVQSGDYSSPEAFLVAFTDFVRIMWETQPDKFSALAADIRATQLAPESCKELFKTAFKDNQAVLEPLAALLKAAEERVKLVEEGN